MTPWEIIWIIIVSVIGVSVLLIIGSLVSAWRERLRRQVPPPPTPPPDVPAPGPVATPARPAEEDPYGYAMEVEQLNEEARELTARLGVLGRAQRNKRMRDRAEAIDRETGFSRVAEPQPRRERVTVVRDEVPTPQPRRPQPREVRRPGPTTQELDTAYERGVADRRAGVAQEAAYDHAEEYPRGQGLQHAYWDGYGNRRQAAPAPAGAGQPAGAQAPEPNAAALGV